MPAGARSTCAGLRKILARLLARHPSTCRMTNRVAIMLWTVLVVLLILWLLGFSFQVAGNLIHILLVVALVVLVLQLVTGRRP